jgi:HEAT repeat protein
VRGIIGLARLGHTDFMLLAGACLGDRDPTLRLAAAQAIAHRGQRDGAGLLLLRLQAGDVEPEISIECLRGLFAVAPEHALRYAQQSLRDASDLQREQTLQALGTASDDRAVELLAAELERGTLAAERQQVIQALGLSRRGPARELLLSIVREGRTSDAEAALSALAIHRYDTRLIEQLRAAAAHSSELTSRFRELTRG